MPEQGTGYIVRIKQERIGPNGKTSNDPAMTRAEAQTYIELFCTTFEEANVEEIPEIVWVDTTEESQNNINFWQSLY
jgi:hypothetical protein